MTKHKDECEALIQAELKDIIEEHGLFARAYLKTPILSSF